MGNIGNKQQIHQAANHVLQQMPVDQLTHLRLPQSRRHIEIDPQRRGDHANAHIQQHNDAKMVLHLDASGCAERNKPLICITQTA